MLPEQGRFTEQMRNLGKQHLCRECPEGFQDAGAAGNASRAGEIHGTDAELK